jgi:hypothetical protein
MFPYKKAQRWMGLLSRGHGVQMVTVDGRRTSKQCSAFPSLVDNIRKDRRDISPADVQGNHTFGGDFAHLNLFQQRFDEVINQIVHRDRGAGDGIYVSLMCLLFAKTRPNILPPRKRRELN